MILILLWLLGVPLGLIIILWLLGVGRWHGLRRSRGQAAGRLWS